MKLKCCPFCGGPAKLSSRPASDAEGGGWVAYVVCYCGGYASCAHKDGRGDTREEAEAMAAAAWNVRAPCPEHQDESVQG